LYLIQTKSHIMKLHFFKSNLKSKTQNKINNVNDIVYTCKMVHTGEVLNADFILKNRSSKYSFLTFK
jgi:hypothetical protein